MPRTSSQRVGRTGVCGVKLAENVQNRSSCVTIGVHIPDDDVQRYRLGVPFHVPDDSNRIPYLCAGGCHNMVPCFRHEMPSKYCAVTCQVFPTQP